ncbi:MAG: ABC transporter permease [Ilumatobacteraceae bacterium]
MKTFKSLSPAQRSIILSLGVVLILSLVRIATNANDITSSGTVSSTLRVATPILLAGLAGLWAERAGIVNIGIEGMMVVGSWLGGYGAWKWGSWAGIALAMAGGVLVGLIHALATVRFNVDHVVSGISVNILAAGSTEYLSIIFFKGKPGGGESQSPAGKGGYGEFDMPFLAGGRIGSWRSPDILGWIERQDNIPLVPDVAALIRGILSDVYIPTLLAVAFVPLTGYILWRTRFGLRVRSSGESPRAGESLGVPIVRLRYQAMAISGALAAFGGAYLSCVVTNTYRQRQVGGQGFIGLATTIFGNWNPFGVFRGALLFGFPTALKFRDDKNVPALLLVGAVILAIVAVALIAAKKSRAAAGALTAAIVAALTYILVDDVPREFVQATPYIVTVLVLAGARQQLRPPAHAGQPYRPGENH